MTTTQMLPIKVVFIIEHCFNQFYQEGIGMLKEKNMTLLKFCDDICSISYCYAVKIYHGQHSSNIVMPFLTSRTIVGLQSNI